MADALLAWEMNGAPISLAHGGPLRLIVPGYTGSTTSNTSSVLRLPLSDRHIGIGVLGLAAAWQG
jgi:sulfite dehydrogenase